VKKELRRAKKPWKDPNYEVMEDMYDMGKH
jgi:hypothetical protein